MKSIYLCGGINGLSDKDCTDWREHCKAKLGHTHNLIDPMRRDYRGKEDESVNEIVCGDYADIAKSDIILVNATRPSWGTAMEMHHAFINLDKYVIAIVGDRVSPWLRYHSHKLYTDFDSAIDFLIKGGF
jgi:nucleoside 2-deoxyribosyltransferase